MTTSPVFTPEEAAAYLGLDKLPLRSTEPVNTLNFYVESGELEYIKIGGTRAFLQDQLDAFLQSLRMRGGQAVVRTRRREAV